MVDATDIVVERSSFAPVWDALASVADPEIPVVSIVDLGIVREVQHDGDRDEFVVRVTPTYSGCPATDVIMDSIRDAFDAAGIRARIEVKLSPPWSTDWITSDARRRLAEYGIAPPSGTAAANDAQRVDVTGISPFRRARDPIACPRCGSLNTRLVSQFGSTACKALMRCTDCLEPFDYFKPH